MPVLGEFEHIIKKILNVLFFSLRAIQPVSLGFLLANLCSYINFHAEKLYKICEESNISKN